MIIYHGSTGVDLTDAREAAPSHQHGRCWTPYKMTPKNDPYILDNGAFHAYKNGVPWDADGFVGRLSQLPSMPCGPTFVVLPDVVTNPKRTRERSQQWADIIDYPTAFAVQDGVEPEEAIPFAKRLEAEYIFVGGTAEWKRRNGEAFVESAHDAGLKCHVGRPNNLTWANEMGADSVDTTSIVRDNAWHKLEQLEEQQTLSVAMATENQDAELVMKDD